MPRIASTTTFRTITRSKLQSPVPAAAAAAVAMSDQAIRRNPHADFKSVESSRPDWDASSRFRYTKTVSPSWTPGSGANEPPPPSARHVAIDPYEAGRPAGFNYKLLISGIVPRPIAFLSTRSPDGSANLAPFSYFSLVSHDPPLFTVSFASSLAEPKDSLRNLVGTRECVVNVVSEPFVEAANAASVDAPPGLSEWEVAGLTPVCDCEDVACARVGEAVLSIEARLESVREFEKVGQPGKVGTVLCVLQGSRFWVREDALNEERNLIDPAVLRPMSRLGGITYGRVTEAIEIPRLDFAKGLGGLEGFEKAREESEKRRQKS